MFAKLTDWLSRFWKLIGGLAVVVGLLAGIAYLVEFGESREPGSTATPVPTAALISTPALLPDPTATMGAFQFIILPDQIAAGEDVLVRVQAMPAAVCHLEYYTPSGNLSTALESGIVLPDSRAMCTWEWHIRADTLPGTAKIVVAINDIKETHEFEILPEK